jgi:hypothetical protein
METIPTTKETILQKKSEINDLLNGAIEHHGHCETARASVLERQRLALWHAWQVGIRLNSIKALIPRGDWADWLELNFCNPSKISVRTAQVYMKIDTDNANLREEAKTQRVTPIEADFQLLTKLKADTIRKYAFGFIPKKFEPNKDRDIKIPRLYSFGNIINEYSRIRYRHLCELQPVDFAFVRKETRELYQFLQWVNGDSARNPWDSYSYDDRTKRALRRKHDRIVEIAEERFREMFATS